MSVALYKRRMTCVALGLAVPLTSLAVSWEPTQTLSEGASYDVATADVDGDGDLDLVFGQYNDYVELWLNDGTGQFSSSGMDLGNDYTSDLYVVDANDDGSPDLFVGGASGYQEMSAQILLNNGSGNFTEDASVSTQGEEAGDWTVADVDGDDHLDLIALTRDGFTTKHSTLSVWYGSDTGYPANPDTHTLTDYSCTALEASDLAGDSGDELVVGCSPYTADGTDHAGGIQVWQHDGTELTALTAVLETDWDIGDIGFSDTDGNGDLDIIGSHFNSSTTVSVTGDDHSVWTNNGGTFSAVDLDFNGISLTVADVDNDNKDDLVLADGSTIRFYRGEDGTQFGYEAGAVETCSVYAQALVTGDVNGDTKRDLIVAGIPYYTSTDPADLVLFQDGTNSVCPQSNDGGSSGDGSSDNGSSTGSDSESDESSDSGGSPGFLVLVLISLLGINRFVGNRLGRIGNEES